MKFKFENSGMVGFAPIYWTRDSSGEGLAYVSANPSVIGEIWLSVNRALSWLVTPGSLFIWNAEPLDTPLELDVGDCDEA